MRKFMTGAMAMVAVAVAASAQAAPAPAYSWNGLYLGANIGYSWGPWNTTSIIAGPGGAHKASVDGIIGGVQGGLNWQIDSRWLLGLEGDFQWSDEKDTFTWVYPIVIGDSRSGFTFAETWKLHWLATIRGRIGMLSSPEWLIYGTGGLAVGKASYGVVASFGGASASAYASDTKWGWTIGGGVEKTINKNWSAKFEYLYVDLGSHQFLTTPVTVSMHDHIVRIGINYKFGR